MEIFPQMEENHKGLREGDNYEIFLTSFLVEIFPQMETNLGNDVISWKSFPRWRKIVEMMKSHGNVSPDGK